MTASPWLTCVHVYVCVCVWHSTGAVGSLSKSLHAGPEKQQREGECTNHTSLCAEMFSSCALSVRHRGAAHMPDTHATMWAHAASAQARAAALKALDEGIMKALSPEATAAAAAAARQAQEAAQHAAPRTRLSVSPSPYIAPTGVNGSPVQSPLTSRRQSAAGVESLATTSATLSSLEKKNEDIQNMLLVSDPCAVCHCTTQQNRLMRATL